MIEFIKDNFIVTTDKSKLDLKTIHEFLSTQSYWAQNRPYEIVEKAVEHSMCFGVYDGERLAGFARIVTDYATFAWLCDVFVLPEYRGIGLGKWLIESIVAHPEIKSIRRLLLATRDAHELYHQYGSFEKLRNPERWMEKFNPQPYEILDEKKEENRSQ
ncbi:MAG TPA: GNAT family N-acetyltransferase [Anaerolineaceae bacterium]|nr:GNAT family N-acetyltransferase [Anaerolineaceae bacterium]